MTSTTRSRTARMAVALAAAAALTAGGAAAAVAWPLTPATTGQPTGQVDHAGHGHHPDAAEAAAIRAAQVDEPLRGSEFRAECMSSHRGPDDPIVYPGQPGVSHIHEFFGNRTTNAHSTPESLRAGATNCDPYADRSAYWVPTLYQHGQPVAPERVTVYYQGIIDPQRAVAPPPGLRYVVGNALATSPDENPSARWSCVGHTPSSRDFLACPPDSKLETYLDFPTCWDGARLDSPNHHDHLTWGIGGVGGSCPSSHPVVLPRLQLLITYPVNGAGLSLAGTRNGVNVTTAPGYTFHGDFVNAWDQAELERRVANCVVAGYICGTDGNPVQQ